LPQPLCPAMKRVIDLFELPRRLGILQYVEYELPPCGGCLYEGWIVVTGCKKGICVRYKVWVWSRDGRTWEAKGRKKNRDRDGGGCLKQQEADALWELAERGYEVAVTRDCDIVINGVALGIFFQRCVKPEECVKKLLEAYKLASAAPRRDPFEELLAQWPELSVFDKSLLRDYWRLHPDRAAQLAETLRRHPWMIETLRQTGIRDPYQLAAVLETPDGSDACLYIHGDFYCNGRKRELMLVRFEYDNGATIAVYRPKGLLAYAADAREYMRVL